MKQIIVVLLFLISTQTTYGQFNGSPYINKAPNIEMESGVEIRMACAERKAPSPVMAICLGVALVVISDSPKLDDSPGRSQVMLYSGQVFIVLGIGALVHKFIRGKS